MAAAATVRWQIERATRVQDAFHAGGQATFWRLLVGVVVSVSFGDSPYVSFNVQCPGCSCVILLHDKAPLDQAWSRLVMMYCS
jgi:hypothetical protein